MIKIVENKKIGKELSDALESCIESIKIISPFLSRKMTDMLCNIKVRTGISISVITRLYLQDMLEGSNDIYAIEKMYKSGIKVFGVRGLHTKLYIADDCNYFIGSANFTMNGLYKNLELVIQINQEEKKIKNSLDEYYDLLKESCIRNGGVINNEVIDEIKHAFEEAKLKRGNDVSKVYTKTYGASIKRAGVFNDFIDPEKEKDQGKRKEIICSVESDLINDAFAEKEDYEWIKNDGSRYFLKLEGKGNWIFDKMVPVDVELNGKKKYILNYPEENRPASINDGDVFYFCTGGDTNPDGSGIQRIVARGHLCEYEKDRYVKKEWVKDYSWMEKFNVYSIINDIEVIDAARKEGINVSEIIKKVGGKIISGSNINSYEPKDFSKSWQGSFKNTTKEASDAIDIEFEKLVEIYGHKIYRSDF